MEALVDVAELVSIGWDPDSLVWAPDPDHPVLGFRCCRVVGCRRPADTPEALCTGCRSAWRAVGNADLNAFCDAGMQHEQWGAERLCLVCRSPGHERPANHCGLCVACDSTRNKRGQSIDAYVQGDERFPTAMPRVGLGRCLVGSCSRLADNRRGLCPPHAGAWRRAGRPALAPWCAQEPPVKGDRAGRVVLRGLDAPIVWEVLFGLQAAAIEGRKTPPTSVRAAVEWLRHSGAASVLTVESADVPVTSARLFLSFTADRLAVAMSNPEREYPKDVWDLRPWGHDGRLSFVGGGGPARKNRRRCPAITQLWLREAAKRWAFEALVSKGPGPVHQMIWAVGQWSDHLATLTDKEARPCELTRTDMVGFLARLRRLQEAGRLSANSRSRAVEDLARFLRECRELGLTAPGEPMEGMADEVVIRRSDRARRPRPGDDSDTGAALPGEVIGQLLSADSLDLLEKRFGSGARRLVELLAGVGRRPDEVCSLPYGCLDYDEALGGDGELRHQPVLVYDMPKVSMVRCRLPIHQREQAIIAAQQLHVRCAYPDTPASDLALFPRSQKNHDGRKPVTENWLARSMRTWVDSLPNLDLAERAPGGQAVGFPRDRVFPMAFRHSFAQRHADEGTAPDVLRDLMGHDAVTTTMGYYKVTAKRKREAQDRLGPLQIDATGRPARPTRTSLSTSEALREQVGQVAVPFGVCTEPANVRAGGGSCPFRHRCLGCEYFRTDPSFQPELRSYLVNLLAERERLAAAIPELAEWARRDAPPSDEEIEALRRLLASNEELIASLADDERAAVEEAIATLRKHRGGLGLSFPVQFRGLVRQTEPTLFPTVERQTAAQRHE